MILNASVKSENFSFFSEFHTLGPFSIVMAFSPAEAMRTMTSGSRSAVRTICFIIINRDLFVPKCSAHTAFQRPPREWLVIIYFDVYVHMTKHFFTLSPAHAYCRRRFASTV